MCRLCKESVECVGHTSTYRLNAVSRDLHTPIWGKVELQNITGSVYDRVVAHMVFSNDPILREGKILALNFVGEVHSLGLIDSGENRSIAILTTNEESCYENRVMLSSKGWRVLGSRREASLSHMYEASKKYSDSEAFHVVNLWDDDISVNVFENTLAKELMDELGCVDYFITSIFDPSVLVGVARAFKKECGRGVKVYGVEPPFTTVVSDWYYGRGKGSASMDPILKFAYDAVPHVIQRERNVIDGFINVDYREVVSMWRKMLYYENINVGYVSSVNVAGAHKFVEKERIREKSLVITILTDNILMYLGPRIFMDQFLLRQAQESPMVSTDSSLKH